MTFSNAMMVLVGVFLLVAPGGARGLEMLNDFQGISYTEVGRPVGMPMGGIGAGSIEVSSQGTLMEFRNMNNWAAHLPSIPGSGLWLTYRVGNKTQVFPLSEGKVRFEGNFPFAKLTFPDLPVDVTLWCWSPFIMHDLRHSAYPAAIFDAQIKNKGNQNVEAGLILSYGTDYAAWLQNLVGVKSDGLLVKIASSSTPYAEKTASGINFSTKAETDKVALDARQQAQRKNLEDAYLRAYDFTPVDISGACNRSYLRHPFGEDPANASMSFSDLKPGKRDVYGIPFQVLDDSATTGKSMVMAGPQIGIASAIIPINQKADCLFFFGNCAGWAGGVDNEYLLRYKDGTQQHIPLRIGLEITDWIGGTAAYCPAQEKNQTGQSYVINVFAVPTDGSKEIESVEIKPGGSAPIVFAVTAGRLSKTPFPEGVVQMRRTDVNRMAGNTDSFPLISNTDASYTLAARPQAGGKVFTYQAASPDALKAAIEKGETNSCAEATVYAVEQRFRLAPGKSTIAGLMCAWYAPNHTALNGRRYGHKYEDWFAGASSVIDEVAQNHDTLLRDTKRHYDIIATSTLPKWYREMIQSNFYLMPACTWLTKDGTAFTYETPDGCPLFGTMDVRYYGSFTKLAAFPELDANVLRQYVRLQKPDGFVPHDLGGSSGLSDVYIAPTEGPKGFVEPSKNRHDYDNFWVNLPIKFCLEVARHYQWTGDKAFLRDTWPSVKAAIVWINAQDEDHDGLPETNYGYDGWRMIDKCGYDANQWNAMLIAVARLANDLGEPDYAASLLATHKKALAQIEKLVWTGNYYKQSATSDGGGLDWVSILQVAGTWYADILGFDDGLQKDHIRTALQTMDNVLGKDALYGLYDALKPDGSKINWWICDGQAIGWQYFYASHAMYAGMDDVALRVADEIWRQFTVEKARIPWCQEEFVHDPQAGVCPYWLLRDSRMGATMVMSYAAAGIQMDIPAGTAAIKPANWVWKDSKSVLPILMPKWLGQVKYSRAASEETYEISNLLPAVALKSLKLRTERNGMVEVSVSGQTKRVSVGSDGTVDVGQVTLSAKPVVVKIAAR
ncbi:MAG: GH116 family glycosyl hydrolase [Armatimonadota bacterium]